MLDTSFLHRARIIRPLSVVVVSFLTALTPLSDGWETRLSAGPPVAPTEALTPDEERQKFRLPPGFEIQLVASEPDIQKPMNLAFDAQGRLWVTHSVEYPFAVTDGQTPRDGITLLSDFAADGRAQKISKFATDLHIPIGVLPLGAGHEAIAWSIPHLWKLTDTDRDGKMDRREVLYGPFDYADTHGNQNALRLGPDGWVYACHGFRNNSQVKLRGDGPVVLTMQSGNTYRFRPDGSAIEQLTWGQVNPFGMCFDRWGDRYSADCHSKALTLLLRGGYYESFGKPHDGLGYAPPMTVHGHDSTGIAGVVHYDATHFPLNYRHCFYVGNVVTNVVHRDVVSWRGSSPWVEKPEDFVACYDPWFHPVDLQMGPDGALYIADFYNSIIGHYEVDLKHPRRDRTRGRIWRVVWKGENAGENAGENTQPAAIPNFTQLTPPQLVERLNDDNQTVRTLATQQLLEREPAAALDAIKAENLSPLAQSHATWVLARQGQLPDLVRALGSGRSTPAENPSVPPATPADNDQAADEASAAGDGVVRAAVLRALAEQPRLEAWASAWVREQLAADQPRVRRLAAETLARHPAAEHIAPLLATWKQTPATDTQLIHTIRLSLRRQVQHENGLRELAQHAAALPPEQLRPLLDVALASAQEQAADFVFDYVCKNDPQSEYLERSVTEIARRGTPQRLAAVAEFAQRQFAAAKGPAEGPTEGAGISLREVSVARAALEGLRLRGGSPPAADSAPARWLASVARRLLHRGSEQTAAWQSLPLSADDQGPNAGNAWGIRNRRTADGREVPVFDSIVNGETRTGILRSAPFTIPAQLTFWLCGHNGEPGKEDSAVNHLRLQLVEDGQEVRRVTAPRNDVAQKVQWDLQEWVGKTGRLEIVDGDTGNAFAWIGAGLFEPAVVAAPSAEALSNSGSRDVALRICEMLNIEAERTAIETLVTDRTLATELRTMALQTSFTLNRTRATPQCTSLALDGTELPTVRAKAAELLMAMNTEEARATLAAMLATSAGALQQQVATALATSPAGVQTLLQTISLGKASPRLLQDKTLLERLALEQHPDRARQVNALTKDLPAADERVRQLVAQRLSSFQAAQPSIERGAAVFKKQCATCHRVAGEGAMIGPQLDGVGGRGAERLLEDILDPSRNVDAAFRVTIITTTDGQVITGIKLREEGQTVVLADQQGKERRVELGQIDEQRQSALSLMPTNVTDPLSEQESRDLLGYLLQQKTRPER